MATAVQGQISAYHDAVMNASKIAVACWDMHKPVQEAVLITPGVVKGIVNVLANAKSEGTEKREEHISYCNYMLRSVNQLLLQARILQDHEFSVIGISEIHEALSQLRFLMADLMDGPGDEVIAKAKLTGCDSPETFKALAEKSHPPQSWYEEDFAKLRGATGE